MEPSDKPYQVFAVMPEPVPIYLDKGRSLLYDMAAFGWLEARYATPEELPVFEHQPVPATDDEGNPLMVGEVPVYAKNDDGTTKMKAVDTGRTQKLAGVDRAMALVEADRISAIIDVLYAGLMHEHRPQQGELAAGPYANEKLDPGMVARMFTPGTLSQLQGPIGEALRRGMARPTVPPAPPVTMATDADSTSRGSTTSGPSCAEEVTPPSGD